MKLNTIRKNIHKQAIIWEGLTNRFAEYKKCVEVAQEIFDKREIFTIVKKRDIEPLIELRRHVIGGSRIAVGLETGKIEKKIIHRQFLTSKNIRKHESMSHKIEQEKIKLKEYEKNLKKIFNIMYEEEEDPDHLLLLYIFYTRMSSLHYYIYKRKEASKIGLTDTFLTSINEAIPFHNWQGTVVIKNPVLRISFTQPPAPMELSMLPFAIASAYRRTKLQRINDINEISQLISLYSVIYLLTNFIHPFNDFNGRASRNLIAGYLLKQGFAPPLYIRPSKRGKELVDMREEFLRKIGRPHIYFNEYVRPELVKQSYDYHWDLAKAIDIIISHLYNKWDGLNEWAGYFTKKMCLHNNMCNNKK